MGNKAHPVHPEKQPLISCLCVTHLKPRMLQRVIECFINQTYENKQLVIVYEEEDQATSEFISTRHFAGNIKRVKIESSGIKYH